MKFLSTRNPGHAATLSEAIARGIAPDGGLYVPEEWPTLYADGDDRSDSLSFDPLAAWVLDVLGADDEIGKLAWRVYGDGLPFPIRVAPLVQIGPGDWMLELFHGPSLSFKDIALQLIGPVYD
ncbi:MAG: threonine synthase, partial [Steroidobacteraceae bacterium]